MFFLSKIICIMLLLPLEYIVLAAIYINILGYIRIHGINVRLVYKIIYKLALFSILLFNVSFIHSTNLDSLPAFKY